MQRLFQLLLKPPNNLPISTHYVYHSLSYHKLEGAKINTAKQTDLELLIHVLHCFDAIGWTTERVQVLPQFPKFTFCEWPNLE